MNLAKRVQSFLQDIDAWYKADDQDWEAHSLVVYPDGSCSLYLTNDQTYLAFDGYLADILNEVYKSGGAWRTLNTRANIYILQEDLSSDVASEVAAGFDYVSYAPAENRYGCLKSIHCVAFRGAA